VLLKKSQSAPFGTLIFNLGSLSRSDFAGSFIWSPHARLLGGLQYKADFRESFGPESCGGVVSVKHPQLGPLMRTHRSMPNAGMKSLNGRVYASHDGVRHV
jgi:hypothetical protein